MRDYFRRSNLAGNMSNDNSKDWQKPWNTEELVNQADEWNLACDAALLNTLKAFGDRVLNVSEGVHVKVENLYNNLNQISLRVDLARNDFNSICDSQFVECRVYEEDETLLTKQEQKKKVEYNVTEDEKMEDLKNAVDLGLHILDEYYDKLEVPVSDSEEDEEVETPSYVYRRKDLYLHRPLPYVIGSEEWHKKWHVGLLESSDSEIEKSASDKFSDSETDDYFEIKNQSDVSSEFSSVADNLKNLPVEVSTVNTSTQNDPFPSTNGVPNLLSDTIPRGSTFAEQLAAKLGNIVKENEALGDPEVNRRPIHKKDSDYGALFSNEPPPVDTVLEDQETDGIFSSEKGLFDDDENDNDTSWISDKWRNTLSTNYLGFDRDGQFGERSFQSQGLFDDGSDDDIFTENVYINNNRNKHSYSQHIKPSISPFHEEPPVLVGEKEIKANKKLAGSVPGFVRSDTFQRSKLENISKNQKSSSSDECDEDTFGPNIIREISETKPVSVSETDKISFKSTNEITHSNRANISHVNKETIEGELQHKRINNLLEGIKPPDLETIEPRTRTSYLFDDISVDDLFSDTHKEFSSNLFTEEDLFSEKKTMNTSETNKKSSTSIITSTKTFSEISDNESFEEEKVDFRNDYDYRWRNISKNKIVSLFDDTDEDDSDIFVSKKSNTVNDQSTKNIVQSEVQICASVGLDIHPEFKPLEKGKLSNDIVPQEKIGRDEFMTENPVDKTHDGNSNKNFDKILENTDSKNHEQCNWKKSSIIDEIHTVQDISQKQDLPTVDGTSKYNSTTQSIQPNDTKGSMGYSRSTDIAQVDFFNLTPPRDDGWDNSSASNIFEYVEPYEIDDFQSQPSSLFDSEPPSLFLNGTSSVVQDVSEKRIDRVKSFDPNLTSSKKFSYDICSGTDDDTCKVSKNIEYPDMVTATRSQCISAIPDFSSQSNTDLTAVGSSEYTHSSASVNSEDEEIFSKSSDRKESEQVNVDVPDKRLGFSVQELLCENEINSRDTRRDFGKTDVLNRKQNADISNDGESKIKIENGKKISASGANADEINTAPSLLDNSFDIEVEYDIFADSDVLLAKHEVTSKQSDYEIGANDVSNIYTEIHVENSSSERGVTYSDENHDDKFSKKEINDMVFTHTTTENNSGISAEHLIETEPITTQFWPSVRKVHSEIGDTSTFIANWGDDSSDASIENEKKSISLIHDSYDAAKIIQSDLPMKKQDADINNCINRENVISDNASIRQRESFDDNVVVNENNSRELNVHQEERDEMQNNISKIVERLHQVSNKQEHNSKLSAVPGKLSHKLDINVGALLPGSAPPRREKTQTPDAETEKLNNEEPDFIRTPISILRTQSETHPTTKEYRLEKSVSFDNVGEVEVLLNVTKNRPKIPIKRRPSSRKARQQYLRNSVPDFQLENESTLEENFEKRCVKDFSSKNSTHNQPLLVSQVSASKEYINTQNEIIQSLEYLNTKSLEHSHHIEKEMRNEPTSGTLEELNPSEEQKNILLFDGEENDSEYLSRIKQSNNRNNINNIKRVVLIKEETSPLEPVTMSGEIDDLFGPLSDNDEFWKRSARFPKNKSPLSSSGNTGVNESKSKRNDENVKISTTTLFDSSDEEDDFFSSLSKPKIEKQGKNSSKTIPNSKIGSKLFDDERTAERDIESSVVKKILKSSNVEVNEDPLSAMLK